MSQKSRPYNAHWPCDCQIPSHILTSRLVLVLHRHLKDATKRRGIREKGPEGEDKLIRPSLLGDEEQEALIKELEEVQAEFYREFPEMEYPFPRTL